MSLPALATQVDATTYGYTLDPATADALLLRASVRIRRAAGQPITPSTVTVELPVEHDLTVLLPAPPVISVTSVTQVQRDGTRTVLTGWRWDGVRLLLACPPAWPPPWRVDVEYQRGWSVIPDGVVELTCQVANRLASTPAGMEIGIRQESIDDYSRTFATDVLDVAGDLLPGEITALKRELGEVPAVWVVES